MEVQIEESAGCVALRKPIKLDATMNLSQIPGQVSFCNFEEIKGVLEEHLSEFNGKTYTSDHIDEAKNDLKVLKTVKKKLSDKEKEIEEAYSLPYKEVKAKIDIAA